MLEKEIAVARQSVREAGKVLADMFGRTKQLTKKGKIDLVTEADLESEKTILDIITRNFPRDGILTEEAGMFDHFSDRLWIIDPLDGTINFAHAFPCYCVSVALEIEREPVLGVVFDPHANEHFEAVKGMGATLNKKPIRVSQIDDLGEALLATGFPYDVHKHPEGVMALFQKMLVLAQGVRRPGSAAIDLCYIAAGRFDGFWEQGLKPWDTAASTVIVREAGGKVTNHKGEPYTPHLKSIVASNALIHEAMIDALNSGEDGVLE